MWKTRTREGMRDSIEKFEIALSKDPDFALAYVGIADAYNQLVMYRPFSSRSCISEGKRGIEESFGIE